MGINLIGTLDSGAAISLIKNSIVKDYGWKTTSTTKLPLVYGNGSRENTDKKLRTEISFEHFVRQIDFHVASDLPVNILLGLDFFFAFQLSLEFDPQTVTIEAHGPKLSPVLITVMDEKQYEINCPANANDTTSISTTSENIPDLIPFEPFPSEPSPNPTETNTEPQPNHVQTITEPQPNHVKIITEPSLTTCRTSPEPSQHKPRTNTEPSIFDNNLIRKMRRTIAKAIHVTRAKKQSPILTIAEPEVQFFSEQPYQQPNARQIMFRAETDNFLPPRSSIKLKLITDDNLTGNTLFTVSENLLTNKYIFTPDSILELDSGHSSTWITNPNPFPVQIHRNSIIGHSWDIELELNPIPVFITKEKLSKFDIDPSLNLDQKKKVEHLLSKYQHLFATKMTDLVQTNLYEHKINLIPNHKPIYVRPYRRSAYEEQIIKEQIEQMIEAKLLQPSVSPFSSPLLLVKKPDGSHRIVSDFRALNKITVRDVYLLPRTSTVLNELGGHKYFSTLDLFSGYFQIPLDPESRKYTSFLTSFGLWEYTVLPMGMMNSGSAFSRLMDLTFQHMKKDTLTWYLDDVAVLGHDFDHHIHNLDKTLKRIEEVNLRLKLSKCHFARQNINFLGFEIDSNGIKPNREKIKAILEMPHPKNVLETQSFLGCINFYRKHIKNHSIIATPLYNLIKKESKFNWNDDCEAAFNHFKQVLTEPPILQIFDEKLPVILESDASMQGLGGIIAQELSGKEHVLEYHSRCLNKHEKNYSITELELLGVIFIIKQARCYVFGRKFKIIVDHSCLRYLANLKNPHGRLARWWAFLSEFNFEVIHRPGRKHSNVDCLSRLPLPRTIPENQDTDLHDQLILLTQTIETTDFEYKLITGQKSDSLCQTIRKKMKINNCTQFREKDNMLVKLNHTFNEVRYLIVLPIALKNEIIQLFHDKSAHEMGVKTYLKMRTRFYHPKLFQLVSNYCKTCEKCQKRNPLTKHKMGSADLLPCRTNPFEAISIDLVGPLPTTREGNKYIFVCVDIATRTVVAKPIPDKKMGTVAKCLLENVYHIFGFPNLITSDRGKEWLNNLFQSLNTIMGIDHRKTTSYHPSGNSIVERANRSLGTAISKQVNEHHDNWDNVLSAIVFGLNTCRHSITGEVPYELLFGRDIPVLSDLIFPPQNSTFVRQREIIQKIRESKNDTIPALTDLLFPPHHSQFIKQREIVEKIRETAATRIRIQQLKTLEKRNEKMSDEILQVNELCLIKKPVIKGNQVKKFSDIFHGPYKVIKILKDGLLLVESMDEKKKQETVNLTNVKKYYRRGAHDEKKESATKENESPANDSDSETEIIITEQKIQDSSSVQRIEIESEKDEEERSESVTVNYDSHEENQIQVSQIDEEFPEINSPANDQDASEIEENVSEANNQPDNSLLNLSDSTTTTEYHDAHSVIGGDEEQTDEQPPPVPPRRSNRPKVQPQRYGF